MTRMSPSYAAARLYFMLEAMCAGEIRPDPIHLCWTTDFLNTLGLPDTSRTDQYKTLVTARLYLMLGALCDKQIPPDPAQLDWATKLFDTLNLPDEVLDEAEADHHKMLARLGDLCPACGRAVIIWEEGCRYCLSRGVHDERQP